MVFWITITVTLLPLLKSSVITGYGPILPPIVKTFENGLPTLPFCVTEVVEVALPKASAQTNSMVKGHQLVWKCSLSMPTRLTVTTSLRVPPE